MNHQSFMVMLLSNTEEGREISRQALIAHHADSFLDRISVAEALKDARTPEGAPVTLDSDGNLITLH
jgi:hypothetical protein